MKLSSNEKIGIVGGGLVGPLAALMLARRGLSSTLIEKRGDLRREKISGGRSINLAISTRGLSALKEIGLEEEALKLTLPMYGRMIHQKSGEIQFQPYSHKKEECIRSISRAGLSALLLDAAEKTGKVSLKFHQSLKSADLDTGVLKFLDEKTAHETELQFDRILGADGSASLIRNSVLQAAHGTANLDRTEYSYKELVMPSLLHPNGAGFSPFPIDPKALHIWPRGSYMLIALPNLDGSFTCTLFLKTTEFERLSQPEKVRAFFDQEFPDASVLLPNLEEEFFYHPTGAMVTVRCFPWAQGERTLLLGDAAHAILPFYGQGMNCGFEDCVALDHLLRTEENWEKVFTKFQDLRKPQSDAIADMAIENFVEMRDKVASPRFLLEKSVEKLLLDRFPNEFLSRYSIVTFSNLPYRFALSVGSVTNEILSDLCQNIELPAQVDFQKAHLLIQEKLKPIIKEYDYGSRT